MGCVMDKIIINEVVSDLSTISDMVRWTVSRFNAADLFYGHGTDNPWDEALHLILPSLYLPLDIPQEVYASRLTLSERHRIVENVIQRVHHKVPVPYITNKAWFCGHEFYVDQNVLIPRSPIGELINNHFCGLISEEPQRILDLCTGSGCIAIACAYEFPFSEVDAVDISPEALSITEHNIAEHGMQERVTPIRSDLFSELLPIQYDVIVTNPPYVDQEDMDDLPDEFKIEPELALAAGNDGLDLVRIILANADRYLTDDGILICEVGNSMVHLTAEYPDVPFVWLSFENGGDGVFMLTKSQLEEYKSQFSAYQR